MSIVLKITSVFLWYFVVLFFFIVWDLNRAEPLFREGTRLGDAMIRFPYQWDFELMFAGIFLVWGIFLWKASRNAKNNLLFIRFTAWAFLVHAISMIIIGLINSQELMHLVNDSIFWFLITFLLFFYSKKYAR